MVDQDLFSADYSEGNLAVNSLVRTIVKVIGYICVIVISVTGFSMVMASIIKNAFHGLYAVFPKFWDKVDAAKKTKLTLEMKSGDKNQVVALMGSISRVIYSLLPNVKAMTDFDGDGSCIDITGFFTKSLPLMCLQIFVGVFIFFSYPVKVAEKFSDFGRGLFDVVLDNVDPLTWVQKLPNEMVRYDLATNGSDDSVDKVINKVSKTVIRTYVSELSDMVGEERTRIARQIESWVMEHAENDYAGYCDSKKYNMSVDARIEVSQPDISRVADKGDDNVHTFAFYTSLDAFQPNTTKNVTDKYIRYDLIFTRKATRSNSSSVECVMNALKVEHRATASGSISANSLVSEVCSDIPSGYGISCVSGAKGKVKVGEEEIRVHITWSENKFIITPDSTVKTSLKGVKEITDVSGVKYKFGSNLHPIKRIVFNKKSVSFTPIDTESFTSWNWGDKPESKNSKSSDSSDKTSSSESDGKVDSSTKGKTEGDSKGLKDQDTSKTTK